MTLNGTNSCRLGLFAAFAAVMATTALSGQARAADKVVVAHSAGINGNAVEAILKNYTAQTGVEAVGSDALLGAGRTHAPPLIDLLLGCRAGRASRSRWAHGPTCARGARLWAGQAARAAGGARWRCSSRWRSC